MHVHRNEDEWYYLLDGQVSFHVGGETHRSLWDPGQLRPHEAALAERHLPVGR